MQPLIKIQFIYPPIPNREFDYCATYEEDEPNDDGNIDAGYGLTAMQAHEDLIINYPRQTKEPAR